MSFETITIERRQPVFDKQFIKVPAAEDGDLPPITVEEAEISIDSPTNGDDGRVDVLSFGRGKEYRTIMPSYSRVSSLDFLTYDRIGLDGYRIETDKIDDIQEAIREIARLKPGSNSNV